jgi:hypothetical protein
MIYRLTDWLPVSESRNTLGVEFRVVSVEFGGECVYLVLRSQNP